MRVLLYTENINHYKRLYDRSGKGYAFQIQRCAGNTAVLVLETITDRTAAERLRGVSLFVKKSDMPSLKEDEFYIHDLIGKKVRVVGLYNELEVIDVKNFGAGDLIELWESEESFFVPFTKANLPEKDGQMFLSREAYEAFKN